MQKSKKQIKEEIRRDFEDILFGLPTKKHKVVIPVVNNCISLGNCLGLDETAILKLAIIQYHNVLSEIMTEKYYEKILETADIKILVKRINGED